MSARWASSETWHRDQRAHFGSDGSYILEIPYAHDDELIMDILKYGGGCMVLAPEELRANVMLRLDEARKNYL
jgi:predicted DNA-binding transcriptional regulator YafY